jgi:hypothetical protein
VGDCFRRCEVRRANVPHHVPPEAGLQSHSARSSPVSALRSRSVDAQQHGRELSDRRPWFGTQLSPGARSVTHIAREMRDTSTVTTELVVPPWRKSTLRWSAPRAVRVVKVWASAPTTIEEVAIGKILVVDRLRDKTPHREITFASPLVLPVGHELVVRVANESNVPTHLDVTIGWST